MVDPGQGPGERAPSPLLILDQKKKTGEESESNLLHENVLTALHWF